MTSNGKLKRTCILIGFIIFLTIAFILINRERANAGWFDDGDWITTQTIAYIFFFATMTATFIVVIKRFIQGGKTSDEQSLSELRAIRKELRESNKLKKGGKTNAKTTDKTPKSKKQRKR